MSKVKKKKFIAAFQGEMVRLKQKIVEMLRNNQIGYGDYFID